MVFLRKQLLSTTNKAKGLAFLQGLFYLAPQPGLEPGTYGLTVRRSTD